MDFEEFKKKYQKKEVKKYQGQVNKNVLVSVCIQTFQHVKYIKKCLDSILIQQTNFDFEILLGEDASTDGTREICIEYAQKYSDKIQLFLHHRENNIQIGDKPSGRFNFLYNLYSAKGKYIALCEGDDYWTDPLKLQKQVDFLEKNPEYTFVAGNTVVKKGDVETPLIKNYNTIQFEDLLEGNKLGVNTCTLCFRKDSLPSNYLEVLIKTSYGDWAITLLLLKQGNGYFLQDILGVYRQHDKGVWSSMSEAEQINGIFKMYNYIEATYPDYGNKINEYQINTIKKIQQSNYNRAMQDFKQSRKVFDLALFKLKLKEKKQIFIKNLFNNGK